MALRRGEGWGGLNSKNHAGKGRTRNFMAGAVSVDGDAWEYRFLKDLGGLSAAFNQKSPKPMVLQTCGSGKFLTIKKV